MKLNKRKGKKRGRKRTKKRTFADFVTDNVAANEVLSPFYFFITYLLMNDVSLDWNQRIFQYTLVSTVMYVYASNYFQPDLDIHHSRPGMGHFPLGRWLGEFRFGRFLKMVAYPINRAWYWLWHPFGYMFTHRGITHWPILSVWLRVGYLWLWATFTQGLVSNFGLGAELIPYISSFKYWLEAFFPWHEAFGSRFWFLFCFPIYLSDCIHIFVDYVDSVIIKGYSFCAPNIPRGYFAKIGEKIFKKK